ncbi:MAG: YfcE family phosphodiesterase [Desulfovermiculus sp.]|nr:YfcE family phosphodiesterase [Desulfovermiculus sp.]
MRIAVLSDTHMMKPSQALITAYEQVMQDMDAIVHCGDITGEQVFAFLNSHSFFYAVAGNMDSGQWADTLPRKTTVRLGEFQIGLIHGFGLGFGPLPQKVVSSFDGRELDLVCFGHTHKRLFDPDGYALPILNPGSFTLPKGSPPGFAWVELRTGQPAHVEWVDI